MKATPEFIDEQMLRLQKHGLTINRIAKWGVDRWDIVAFPDNYTILNTSETWITWPLLWFYFDDIDLHDGMFASIDEATEFVTAHWDEWVSIRGTLSLLLAV